MNTARRILVSGASRGIGAGLVRHYLSRGDQVFGCARGDAAFSHPRYSHLHADVTVEADVHQMFRVIRESAGGLDVLINNAGVASMNPLALTPSPTARQVIATNFLGTFLMTHAAVRLLRTSSAGRIVNLTTVAVPFRLDGEAVYAASKSAVETFTRIAARELGPLGITCNAVGPGPAHTALTEGIPPAKIEALVARQAIPRWTETADVANVVDFFLMPESGLVTGQIIYLGGAG